MNLIKIKVILTITVKKKLLFPSMEFCWSNSLLIVFPMSFHGKKNTDQENLASIVQTFDFTINRLC
ncbi:hypothetical protein HMPREF3001_17025 [Enterococcus sp. HMSC066C04]|nr:hypothetical protein HMPREF3001_17025 [Enterococcus sp. HMSC066C04]